MLIVVAVGGNALARRDAGGIGLEPENVRKAAQVLAELAPHHDLVVTHGNGPQVGLLALQSEAAGQATPLDVLGAESEGMIGYRIEQELSNLLPRRDVATLLTQVEVSLDDPAFQQPRKPIGPIYSEESARRLSAERGWCIAPAGDGFQRVVPSPEPRRILELRTIRILVKLGVIVVCAGGGGIPVVRTPSGPYHGVEAVIDKDLAAELLAARLGADMLLLLTDVPCVFADWPEPARRAIRAAPPRDLADMSFEPGSMGPKVQAAYRFARAGGTAAIGALEDAPRILRGETGTRVSADVAGIEIEEG